MEGPLQPTRMAIIYEIYLLLHHPKGIRTHSASWLPVVVHCASCQNPTQCVAHKIHADYTMCSGPTGISTGPHLNNSH